MNRIVSGKEMKVVDNFTINEIGIPSIVLMERAAFCVAEEIIKNESVNNSVIVVAGTGNNGADGLAVARMLYLKNYNVSVYVKGDTLKASEEFKTQYSILQQLQVPVLKEFENKNIVVDALFGVGLSRNIEGDYADLIKLINDKSNKIYAVDIPSGIDSDTGRIMGIAIKADYTVTFGAYKIGTVLYPGADYCGNVTVADIGFPNEAYKNCNNNLYCVTDNELSLIPKRPNYSNKGTFGKVLIIAGSKDISGAAYLCAKAAFRVGAGLVRIFTAKENREVLQKLLPEAMVNTYDTEIFDDKALMACLNWCDVVAIGPGFSTGTLQKNIIKSVLSSLKPTVIDADGINNISQDQMLKKALHNKVVLTPHLLEAARLNNTKVENITGDLIGFANDITYKYNVRLILKDARTVISTGKNTYINMTGNNGMATAGSGDVLTGIVTGLLAIGTELDNAAALGPFIHGRAGDLAVTKLSKSALMATDIIDELPKII